MIIAVNTRFLLSSRMEGIGRFTFEILKRVTKSHKDHTFIFFFDRKYDKSFVFSDNIIPVVLFPPARHPFLWYWFFNYSITKALKKYNADLFVTTDGWLSTKTKVKTLQVLHDLHYENFPEFLPFLTRKYYQFFFPKFVHKATRIITVSNFCKNEIANKYLLNRNKIDVVYNSTREDYYLHTDEEKKIVRNKYTQGKPYFLFIGPIHPRKNLENVIDAFRTFKKKNNSNYKLIVTGSYMWKNFGRLKNKIEDQIFQDIIYTGYISQEELHKITSAAFCLLYVSFYEGFGMPILEAMSCNVPVITSDKSAMPEVAGDAAILVDPYKSNSICDAMEKLYYDEKIRNELIFKGSKNLLRYSWDNSAKLFWDIMLMTVNRIIV